MQILTILKNVSRFIKNIVGYESLTPVPVRVKVNDSTK